MDRENGKSELPLDSLEIKGYRCFEHLTIEKLGRVNLIVGKNNVGKTALLEALWIYAEGIQVVDKILASRKEDKPTHLYVNGNVEHKHRHLFYERIIASQTLPEVEFAVGPMQATAAEKVAYICKFDRHRVDFFRNSERRESINNYLITTSRLDEGELSVLWDEIELTELEDKVTESLKIILPGLLKVRPKLVQVTSPHLIKVIQAQVKGFSESLPLQSFGEGLNRFFEISLTLANCRNGILLVDEIEAGLHYSILPDVWKVIFHTAKELNVQVFATTHSKDCVEAFASAAVDSPEDGMLIRLERHGAKIVAKTIEEERLADALDYEVEVR